MKRVLVDASSAILLFKADLFGMLARMYHVMVADAVYDELTCDGYPGSEAFKKADIGVFQASASRGTVTSLGRGERDTIAGFHQGLGDFVMVDDGAAARYCRQTSVPFVNALLFPKMLYLSGKINETEYRRRTENILLHGRYSEKVIAYAERCPRSDLDFFLP